MDFEMSYARATGASIVEDDAHPLEENPITLEQLALETFHNHPRSFGIRQRARREAGWDRDLKLRSN
jgi:hypothetical protein